MEFGKPACFIPTRHSTQASDHNAKPGGPRNVSHRLPRSLAPCLLQPFYLSSLVCLDGQYNTKASQHTGSAAPLSSETARMNSRKPWAETIGWMPSLATGCYWQPSIPVGAVRETIYSVLGRSQCQRARLCNDHMDRKHNRKSWRTCLKRQSFTAPI